ncbi:MAG: hypothetical protein KH409_05055 [Clostridium sp.]|nr:hypothetical protein [Clostridium sp.]
MEQLTFEKIKALIGERKPTANKGDNGRALIIAGSELMSGAALMCAAAALRAGVGTLKAIVPNGARQAFYSVPECMCIAFGGEKWNELDESFIAPYIAEASTICVGPGMGKDSGVENTVRLALAARMARLTGLSTAYIKENQAEVAAKYAEQWGCTVLLKSYRSVIACHDGRIALNTNGNSGLAKGGSGDVLSGITLAMLSQGLDTFGAACAGAYTLGASAEEAMALLKERMLMARDVTDAVEQTVNKLFE